MCEPRPVSNSELLTWMERAFGLIESGDSGRFVIVCSQKTWDVMRESIPGGEGLDDVFGDPRSIDVKVEPDQDAAYQMALTLRAGGAEVMLLEEP